MGALTITDGVPEDWDEHAGSWPAAGRARWIGFGQSWFPGRYLTFALRGPDGTCRVAMGGAVLPAPAAVPRRDPWHILTGRTADLGLFTADEHPWPSDLDPDEVYPCLVLMYPYYATFPVGSEATDPDGLAEYADALVEWAKAEGVRSVAVLYLTPPADPLVAALAGAGFKTAAMGERCDMPVTWSDFDGYLRSLRKKYRDEVKREINRMEERSLTTAVRALEADEPELLDLRCRLIEKYDGSVNRADQAAIFDMIRRYVVPEDITVFTVSDGDDLISFSLFIQDGPEWTVMLTGTAYGKPNADYGYFSCMFYQPAAMAPAKGITQVSYGYGTLDAKRRRGCLLYPYQAAELRLSQ
ncbi:GNAT family N-acetyltransferase [Saccharothrix isguenensis]